MLGDVYKQYSASFQVEFVNIAVPDVRGCLTSTVPDVRECL